MFIIRHGIVTAMPRLCGCYATVIVTAMPRPVTVMPRSCDRYATPVRVICHASATVMPRHRDCYATLVSHFFALE